MKSLFVRLLFLIGCTLGPFVAPTRAADAAPGTITGRVFNPATGEYRRNAQIRIEETGQTVVSEDGGKFRLWPVAPGRRTLTVTFTGYRPATATLEIAPGATVTRDFELVSLWQETAPAADGAAVKLTAFVVAGEREGNAKAIMDQRQSMNITNSVAADIFGDNAEGNLGEFLKHMPGVDVSTAFGEVRTVGLRGLGSEYTAVTVDGLAFSSADPTLQGAVNSRAFTFENVSLGSMEAIEVSKTVSADMDANAPAGTINLRTKRAFERAGRRISWQANLAGHSTALHLRRTLGPDERRTYKLRPGGLLEWSDVFFNRRLGIVLSVSESNLYQEANVVTLSFDRTPTAADRRPEVITQFTLNQALRFNERFATTITADFKATDRLVLSFGAIYNWSELWNPQRNIVLTTGPRTTVVGADPLVSFTTNAATVLAAGRPTNIAKLGQTTTLLPKFEYKAGRLAIEGKAALSRSYAWYDPMNRQTSIVNLGAPSTAGVTWRGERVSVNAYDWKITQTAGPDWSLGYTNAPAASVNDFRSSRRNSYGGELTATLATAAGLPVVWKTGLKTNYESYNFANLQAMNQFTFAPGGVATNWNGFRSVLPHAQQLTGMSVTSLSGGGVFMPDLLAIGRRFAERPGDFQSALTAANFITSHITAPRRYEETIDAAFLMGTAKLGRASTRVGLRWEDTGGDATELAARSAGEVRAAGFAVGVNGRATTISGLEYQFFSLPRAHRRSSYDHLFPSGSFKYAFSRQLDFHAGYSKTIRRPAFKDVAGLFDANEQTRTVATPNIGLRPEFSDNVSVRLAWYFEPVGVFALNAFQNDVRDLMITNSLTAAQYGYAGPEDYSAYAFNTTVNSPDRTKLRGVELEYFQSLTFLPGALKGLGVRAAWSRNTASTVVPGLAAHKVSAGLSYALGRWSANLNGLWEDDSPLNTANTSYRRHRASLDASASVRLRGRTTLFVSARNLTNSRYVTMDRFAPSPAIWRTYELYGTTWTAGVKGTF